MPAGVKTPLSLSTHGKIFKWQDISAFGKILDGAIRAIDSAAWRAIYFRHVEAGRFRVKSGNSPRRRKRKLLSFNPGIDAGCHEGDDMRLPGKMLVTAAFFSVLWSGPAESTIQKSDRCAAEAKAVETARAAFAAATQATLALYDQIDIKEQLIAAQEAVLKLKAAAEQQAKNEWQGAIDRYMACASKPRNNVCEAEKKAMDDATDRLNVRLAERRKVEGELKESRDALADLQKALDKARDAWALALAALQKARAALAACQRQIFG
jgi:nitrate reductase assembly molybdenum cofactor insertion protein NarJ